MLKTYKTIFLNALSFLNDTMEAESMFYIILEKVHALKRIDLALQPHLELAEDDLQRWEEIIVALKSKKPLQYIIGETEFYGLRFEVNESTLIPRPETEELVELIVVENRKSEIKSLKILDIGTGSGCIAISLAKNLPNATVSAIDVSENALEMAKKNAELNAVNVNFMLKNILETAQLPTQFDIIVSNPPYVRNLEKLEIKANVLEFEPHLALFVEDNNALIFYEKIAELAQKNLSESGKLYFEINQYLGKETVQLLEKKGFKNIKLIKDIYGNDRMISCKK